MKILTLVLMLQMEASLSYGVLWCWALSSYKWIEVLLRDSNQVPGKALPAPGWVNAYSKTGLVDIS
jgi:hypothetical protein